MYLEIIIIITHLGADKMPVPGLSEPCADGDRPGGIQDEPPGGRLGARTQTSRRANCGPHRPSHSGCCFAKRKKQAGKRSSRVGEASKT